MSRLLNIYEAFLEKVPQQSRSRSVVEAILGAASERLMREGDEERVTVQAVAERAGVGIGSLYDYFGDRGNLLAAIAAKVTEDNRHAFEALLASTAELSIEEGVGRVVDFCIARFATRKRGPRAILKIAHAVGMMPTVAASTDVAAEALARTMKARNDIRVPDVDLAAWTATHAMMGVFHTLIWEDDHPPIPAIRAELVTMISGYLAGEAARDAASSSAAAESVA